MIDITLYLYISLPNCIRFIKAIQTQIHLQIAEIYKFILNIKYIIDILKCS